MEPVGHLNVVFIRWCSWHEGFFLNTRGIMSNPPSETIAITIFFFGKDNSQLQGGSNGGLERRNVAG